MISTVQFRTTTDLDQSPLLCAMMAALYAEDHIEQPEAEIRFPETVRRLVAEPERGRIMRFIDGETPVGYALLIPYWSNEFGGVILFIDELYVVPTHRGRGIGREFFRWVERERPFSARAMFLEVSRGNPRARGLYERLGFLERANATMAKRLNAPTGPG